MESVGYRDRRDETKGLSEQLDETYKDPVDCVRYTELYEMMPSNIEEFQPITTQELEEWQDQV